VKSLRIGAVDRIELGPLGAHGDRVFCVIDARDRMINAKRLAALLTVVAGHDAERDALALTFPDGSVVDGPVAYGETVPIAFHSESYEVRLVVGPWADALSEHVGQAVRIARPVSGVDRGREGGVSLISTASLRHFAEIAGVDEVDPRRFRMLIQVEGVEPYEEDTWVGRRVQVGDAVVAVRGNVGRCLITGLDPDRGVPTLPTLDLLGTYRVRLGSTEPLPLGVYGEVVEPGSVTVGDRVALDGRLSSQ
jgi:uncharacterized protein YcbX